MRQVRLYQQDVHRTAHPPLPPGAPHADAHDLTQESPQPVGDTTPMSDVIGIPPRTNRVQRLHAEDAWHHVDAVKARTPWFVHMDCRFGMSKKNMTRQRQEKTKDDQEISLKRNNLAERQDARKIWKSPSGKEDRPPCFNCKRKKCSHDRECDY